MRYKLLLFFLVTFTLFSQCEIPELKKFEDRTETYFSFETPEHGWMIIDIERLIRKTIMVESECNPKIKHPVAKGITQIEPFTFKSMAKDINFKNKFLEIEKKYGVDLDKNWDKDTYTNIVAAFAVYQWKFFDKASWWDKRFNFEALSDNYIDREWNVYKIFFNSIIGKTTLHRWEKFNI